MQGMSAWDIRKDIVKYSNPAEYEKMVEQENSESLLDKIVNAAKSIVPKALSVANAAMAQLSYSGSTGNFQTAEEVITLSAKFQPIVDQFPERIGSPLYRQRQLGTLTGFIQCQNAEFSASDATMREEMAIESFLNNGFFYE